MVTIHNDQPYSGRAGDPKPDWLAWGAPAFAVACGRFLLDCRRVCGTRTPATLQPGGELLRNVSLEGLSAGLMDVEADENHLWGLGMLSR